MNNFGEDEVSPITESHAIIGIGDLQARGGSVRFWVELAFLIDLGTSWLILSSSLWDVRPHIDYRSGMKICK